LAFLVTRVTGGQKCANAGRTRCHGLTEDDGPSKLQDVKLMDQAAGHEIVERENDGQKIRKCSFLLLFFSTCNTVMHSV